MLKGAFTAIVTPFKNGKIDFDEFGKLIDEQIKSGIDGIVPCGTTGESPTLSDAEHKAVIEFTVKTVANRVPVIGGAGSNDTAAAVAFTRHCKEVGCDAVLSITPYYNKPTQKGLFAHFKACAKAADIPVVLYNVPGRTSVSLAADTVIELSYECENIAALKDATGDIVYAMQVLRGAKKGFVVLAGNDDIVYPVLSIGGQGVISVVTNLVPEKMKNVTRKYFDGDREATLRDHMDLLPLCKALFIETNPIPIKTAMGLAGKCSPELRLPLTEMAPANLETLKSELKKAGII